MGKCSHIFIGNSTGVHCTCCGITLTPKEYDDLISLKTEKGASQKPQQKRTRKKVSTNE